MGYVRTGKGRVEWKEESKKAMLRVWGRVVVRDLMMARAEALWRGARSVRASRWW